jgi:hypothetical protein
VSGQPRRAGRVVSTALAVLALLFATVALVVRGQPVTSIPRLILAVGSTFVPLAALVGLVLAVLARRRLLAIFGVFVFTATLAIQANWYFVSNPKDLAGPVAEVRVRAKAQLDNFAREAGPAAVIIGGDYNSTPDMRQSGIC